MVTGTVKQIALALVLAQESPSVQYQYLVGRGNLTIDNFYRDKLALTEYTGTATATTTSTVDLAAGDQEADDFYNNKFIEMDGEVRLITDYVSSTNKATVDPTGAWSAGAYTIREWKKITQVKNTITYTLVEFARRQRDSGETLFKKDRMSADVTGATTERNPSRFIETLLGLFPDVALNAAGFTTAATAIDTEGNLFVDGALVTQKRVFDILTQVCHIGRLRLRLNDSGELYPVMDGTDGTIRGLFNSDDNIISIGTPEELPLSQLWKTLELRYRLLFDEGDFRLTTAKHDANASEGRINQSLDYDLVFDKTTADKLCDYLAKRKNSFDNSLDVTLNHEARGLELGQLINLVLNVPLKSDTYQIISKSLLAQGYQFAVIPYDAAVFTHTVKTEPSDPVTDGQADFRFTDPKAVTSLAVVHSVTVLNVSASAALSWVNPTTNFKEVLVEYKLSSDSIYNTFTTTSGTQVEIPGLTPGINYDFRVTTINNFNLTGGVAEILNSTAAGDTGNPNPPTALTALPEMLGMLTWKFTFSTSTDVKEYKYEISTNSGMTAITFTGRTKNRMIEFPAKAGSGLASAVTRWARVKTIDNAGNESAFEPSSGGVSNLTSAVIQGSILTNEVVELGSFANDANFTNGVSHTVTVTTRNKPVTIVISYVQQVTSGGLFFTLKRATTTIYATEKAAEVGFMAVTHRDAAPGTGSRTYTVTFGNNPTDGISMRRMVVTEHRNG